MQLFVKALLTHKNNLSFGDNPNKLLFIFTQKQQYIKKRNQTAVVMPTK